MNPAFVVDCSVAVTWCFRDEATSKTNELRARLKNAAALVPALWYVEIANVIFQAERKGRIGEADREGYFADLGTLDIQVDHEGSMLAFTHVSTLCRSHGLTAYDAVYLELAVRRGLPLATLDAALRRAGEKLGVPLLGK